MLLLCAGALPVLAISADGNSANDKGISTAHDAKSLRASHEILRKHLARNAFGLPVHLRSIEASSSLEGEIYARVDYPYAVVYSALTDPSHWCDVLILHPNTKFCHANGNGSSTALAVNVGSKHDESLDDTYRVDFTWQLLSRPPDYFRVQLHAGKGPLSTRDYRISLEAVALGKDKTFLRLTYAYDYGLAGRLALRGYFATIGSDKAGFTVVGQRKGGQPKFVNGVRGLVERNTLRYYLGIDAFLAAVALPPAQRREARLQHWFAATERWPRQLHEMDRVAYLRLKHGEYARQAALTSGNSKP